MGSPMVTEVSRAILNVTEGPEMAKIEKNWLGAEYKCSELRSSDNLGLGSFWGLFLIVGLAGGTALIIQMIMLRPECIARRRPRPQPQSQPDPIQICIFMLHLLLYRRIMDTP